LIIILLSIPTNSSSADITPLGVVRDANTKILTIYRLSPTANKTISSNIQVVMDQITDFKTIAERTTQKICAKNSDELCNSLKGEFIKLLKLTATKKMGRYRADRFEYHGEEVIAEQAVVKTTAHYQEDSVQLDYILEKKDGKWFVVNYIADEVNTIQNYQSQFNRIVRKNSVEFLVKRLKKKNNQHQKE
jgi:ABC-type transporter MlaC component